MTAVHRALAWWLIAAHAWSPAANAAPASDALVRARVLHDEANAARKAGEFAAAAEWFKAAHEALPDTCTPTGLKLLDEADAAYRKAHARAPEPLHLCEDERMLAGALEADTCAANSAAIDDLLRAVRKQLARERIACPAVSTAQPRPDASATLARPAPRWLDESLPTAVADATPPERPDPRLLRRPAAPRRAARITGAVLLGTGAAAAATLAVAAWRSAQSERSIEALLQSDTPGCTRGDLSGACQRLDQQGQRMNHLAIASGVLAGALVVSGVVLLLVGRRPAPRRVVGAVGGAPGLTWRF